MADVESPKAKWPIYVLIAAIVISAAVKWGGFWKTSPQETAKSAPLVYTYDFSKVKAPKTLTVKFYQGKVVGVNIPDGVWFKTIPDSDVQICFLADGKCFIDGPSRRVSYGDRNSLTMFNIVGLEKSGEMKLILSPRH